MGWCEREVRDSESDGAVTARESELLSESVPDSLTVGMISGGFFPSHFWSSPEALSESAF